MIRRWQIIGLLIVLLWASVAVLNQVKQPEKSAKVKPKSNLIDHYSRYTSILFMRPDGRLQSRLYADYMAHYPDASFTKLTKPRLEMNQAHSAPIIAVAESGWISDDNTRASLNENVNLWQHDPGHASWFKVTTEDARILIDKQYIETERDATITGQKFVFDSVGMKVYMQQHKVELMSNVYATIKVK